MGGKIGSLAISQFPFFVSASLQTGESKERQTVRLEAQLMIDAEVMRTSDGRWSTNDDLSGMTEV